MTTIRPNAEPAATTVAGGDIFLIDGATGVRALAASVVPLKDANGNVTVNNLIQGLTSTATAAGTTILTVASTPTQLFTGTTTQIVTLPVVSTLQLNQSFTIQNTSTGAITVNSSGGNLVATVAAGAIATIKCILLTGTTAASWSVKYDALVVTTGKVLTVSNSLTLVGTDATVLTFPTTSATIARTDTGQTFTGTNVFGILTATSINGLAVTTSTGTLTIANLKTLTASNTLILAGTDGTIITFQASDIYVGRATTDTLTNKTFDTAGTGNSFKINGVAITANTGTGSNVLGTAPTLSQPNLVGTTTNDNAAAGSVGEYVESVIPSGSAVTLVTATPKDVTTLTLGAGDWDIDGQIGYVTATSTSITFLLASISQTANTSDFTSGRWSSLSVPAIVPGASTVNMSVNVMPVRFSLSGSTTFHLVTQTTFTASTLSAYGIIRARRVR